MADRGTLVVVATVAATFDGDTVTLDDKLYSGLDEYRRYWKGRVVLLTPVSDAVQPYSTRHLHAALPFMIARLDLADATVLKFLSDAEIVLASADDHKQLSLWQATARPVVYVIEYTLRTRLQQIRVSRSHTMRKVKTAVWTLLQERRLRRALRNGAAVQCNGTPAHDAYKHLNPRTLLYFDTRMTAGLTIDPAALLAKMHHVESSARLRLVYSGRLETIKGAHHLVAVARALAHRAVDFSLDIFGTGSLFDEMREAIDNARLRARVRLHGAVDFTTVLVPFLCGHADLFLCCHLQDDPSCTYLETLACGVPIAGYRNRALEGVFELGDCGAVARSPTPRDMASLIAELDGDRPRLARLMRSSASVGRDNSFEAVFAARVDHLIAVADDASD